VATVLPQAPPLADHEERGLVGGWRGSAVASRPVPMLRRDPRETSESGTGARPAEATMHRIRAQSCTTVCRTSPTSRGTRSDGAVYPQALSAATDRCRAMGRHHSGHPTRGRSNSAARHDRFIGGSSSAPNQKPASSQTRRSLSSRPGHGRPASELVQVLLSASARSQTYCSPCNRGDTHVAGPRKPIPVP
jgi:hypothetical protein